MPSEPLEFDLHLSAGSKFLYLLAVAACTIFSSTFLTLSFQPQPTPRAVWTLLFVVFTISLVVLMSQGGLKNGRIVLDVDSLTIEQHGRSARVAYSEITMIALTKIVSGRSLTQAVLVEKTNFSRIYIEDSYLESSEFIFELLKRHLEPLAPSMKFILKQQTTAG